MKPTPLHPDAEGLWTVTDVGDLFGHVAGSLPRKVDSERLQAACFDLFAAGIALGLKPGDDWRPLIQVCICGYALGDVDYKPFVLV